MTKLNMKELRRVEMDGDKRQCVIVDENGTRTRTDMSSMTVKEAWDHTFGSGAFEKFRKEFAEKKGKEREF